MTAKSKQIYAEVAPAVPLPINKSQTFTYQIKEKVAPGSFVKIPIGRRFVAGVVIETHSKKPPYYTKPVSEVFPAQFTRHQLEFARWIANTMQGGLGFTLRLFAPPAGQKQSVPAATSTKQKTTGLHTAFIDTFEKRWKSIPKYIKQYTKQDQQVLVLVPELWMTEKIAERISGAIAYHGKLTSSTQGDIWRDVYAGTAQVIVGTQKALFLPWQNLKLIVLEEEQFESHKLWDRYPRIDNRIAAKQVTTINEAATLLSSSFPSVSLWHSLKEAKVTPLQNNQIKLKPSLIDSSFQDRKDKRLLPQNFLYQMRKWTREGEKIFVLYNKLGERGLKEARHIFHKSPTLHAQIDKNITIGTSGLLTQIEHKTFDRVVWIYPEIGMRFPDYRSYERALITLARLQAHTKSRRSVTIVTRYKKMIEEQLLGDPEKIYERLLKERKSLKLPPYTDIIKLTCTAKTAANAHKRAEQLRQNIEKRTQKTNSTYGVESGKSVVVRGPYNSLKEVGQKPQSHILLQGNLEALTPLYHGLPVDIVDVYPQQVL